MISTGSEGSGTLNCSPGTIDYKGFKATWNEEVHQNREKWKTQAAKGTLGLGPLNPSQGRVWQGWWVWGVGYETE